MSDAPAEQSWPVLPERGARPVPSSTPLLRASDADRDRVAALLGDAFAQGRLTQAEHADRLGRALNARTVGELEPLTADLVRPAPTAPAGWAYEPQAAPTATLVSLFGGTKRTGRWLVPASIVSFTMFGGTELDLRDAAFTSSTIDLGLLCMFGGVTVIVPPGVNVDNGVIAIFGGSEAPNTMPQPGAPTLHLRGLCAFGGVTVKVKGPRTPPPATASAADLR